MKKILLTEEVEKALVRIYDCAERYAGCKAVLSDWALIGQSVVEDPIKDVVAE